MRKKKITIEIISSPDTFVNDVELTLEEIIESVKGNINIGCGEWEGGEFEYKVQEVAE